MKLATFSCLTLAAALALPGAAAAQGAFDMTEMLKPGPLPEMTLGKADAPITLIEYASMTCSHCAAFNEQVFPKIKQAYIDTGKIPFEKFSRAVKKLQAAAQPQ